MYKIAAKMTFAAAHSLRGYEGACEKIHGHNWQVKAILGTNQLNKIGIAYDFKQLKQNLKEIIDKLDHEMLNEIPPFDNELNPTSENLAKYIFYSLRRNVPEYLQVVSVEVSESEKYSAIYEE